MDNIIIPNEEEVNKKLLQIKEGGSNKLHIIADFDKTLTTAFIDGNKIHTSYAILREHNLLAKEYTQKAKLLFSEFYPFEISETLSLEEKKKKMDEWWVRHYQLMVEFGITKNIIKSVMDKKLLQARPNLDEFFNIIKTKKIPLLIFSAGLGDIITLFLKNNNWNNELTSVLSNFIEFDQEGNAIGVPKKFIHTFNKNEFSIEDKHKEIINNKPNVILLGDSLGDINMADGIPHNTVLKIGFLNTNKNEEQYKKEYDILILNDGPMDYINQLITNLFN